MAGENGLEIVGFETLQQVIGIEGPILHGRTHWKMSKDHHGPLFVELLQMVVHKTKRVGVNCGLGGKGSHRAIQRHNLPAVILEVVIEPARKAVFVSATVEVWSRWDRTDDLPLDFLRTGRHARLGYG